MGVLTVIALIRFITHQIGETARRLSSLTVEPLTLRLTHLLQQTPARGRQTLEQLVGFIVADDRQGPGDLIAERAFHGTGGVAGYLQERVARHPESVRNGDHFLRQW